MTNLELLKEKYKIQLKKFYRIEFEKEDEFYNTKLNYAQGVLSGLKIAIEAICPDDTNSDEIVEKLDFVVRSELIKAGTF